MAAAVKQEVKVEGPMIYRLVGQAMGRIRAIGKDSSAKNYSGKEMYKFRGIDAVYNALNPVMSDLGLFIIPEVMEINREERTSSNGTTLIYSIARVKYTMYAPDGSFVQAVVVGEGMDSGDKSMNKAMSIALKYFCFQIFMIPTEEMADPDAEVHEVKPKTVKAPEKPKAPAAEVTTQAKVPAQTNIVNPALGIIKNELQFISNQNGADFKEIKAKFELWRKTEIGAGRIKDIAYSVMDEKTVKELIEGFKKSMEAAA